MNTTTKMKRLLLPAGSLLPEDTKIDVLYTYPNGDRLINLVDARSFSDTEVEEINSGLQRSSSLTQETLKRAKLSELHPEATILAYVAFIGPITKEWVKLLEEHGVEILSYQPRFSYLCRAKAHILMKIQAELIVEEIVPLENHLKRATAVSESGATLVI